MGLELKECHSHIDELRNTNAIINKRYEELHAAKAHLDKLFQSLNTGTDANANRFQTEKLQWNEDKMQFMEDLRVKDNKILEMQIVNEQNAQLIKELKQMKMEKDNDDSKVDEDTLANENENEKNKKQLLALLDTAKIYKAQNEKNSGEIAKLREKLKAYKRRDEVNKQLRDNWNKQLNQMEQAVLLANDIYNRERTRHETEMAEKDVEIMKLRKFLLSFTNKQRKTAKIHSHSHQHRNGMTSNGSTPNGHHKLSNTQPGAARKSKIVKPKVIKPGASRIRNGSGNGQRRNGNKQRRVRMNFEHKSEE